MSHFCEVDREARESTPGPLFLILRELFRDPGCLSG